jgi:sortase A
VTHPCRRLIAAGCIVAGVVTLGAGALAHLRLERPAAPVDAPESPPVEAPARLAPGQVIGLIEIPRLGLREPIMEGDDERTLARGVGRLMDSALPWESGNTALAAHRDGAFRPLARIARGDRIHLTTPYGRREYAVARTDIVEPTDLSVLRPAERATLTLITCYPFRLIGPAPQRFVVRAEAVDAEGSISAPPPRGPRRSP